MKLDNVKYAEGKPYVETAEKGRIRRRFGHIIKCQNCGEDAFIFPVNLRREGKHYCSQQCNNQYANNSKWNGGIKKHSEGYRLIKNPSHPFASKDGYVMEHRLVVEKQIGRYLHRNEVVHHVNKITDDNRIDNLMVFSNDGVHRAFDKGLSVDKKYIVFDGRGSSCVGTMDNPAPQQG